MTCRVEEVITMPQSMGFGLRQMSLQSPALSLAVCDFGHEVSLCSKCFHFLIYKMETMTALISQALEMINHIR